MSDGEFKTAFCAAMATVFFAFGLMAPHSSEQGRSTFIVSVIFLVGALVLHELGKWRRL